MGRSNRGVQKLHTDELRDFSCSQNIISVITSRRNRWVGRVARMGEKTNAHRDLVWKHEEQRQFGRPRR
jgi:hypothetical protein